MPRNPQGLYTLPAGNPVVPNTLIESAWANTTMDDVATALTGSLPRDGSAPMTGPLTLAVAPPSQPRHAVSKGYLESFLAYATGMPIGSLLPIAGATVPSGFLLCDGQAVSRTTYADLFASIGTIYGSGDGTTTFNVPDLRDWFVRGKADSRPVGSTQAASFASHTHPLQDPGHAHGAFQTAHDHTITTGGHNHSVNDPGHFHQATFYAHNDNGPLLGNANGGAAGTLTTDTRGTGVTLNAVGNLGGSADARQPAVTVNSNTTGASIGVAGGADTVPQNIAMNYVIKAVNDPGSTVALTGITSSDENIIAIDNTLPNVPELAIHSNVAFGTVKLNANAKIPQNLVDISTFQYLGPWDASGGQNPSQALPSEVFANGDLYQISVGGTLQLYDAVGVLSSIPVVSTDQITYITNSSVGLPTGWYFQPTTAVTGITAVAVSFAPTGSISATNVQNAIVEVAAEATPIAHVGSGGAQHANVVAAGAAGFMTGADKTKLDGIAAGAQVNTVQSVNGQTGMVALTAADVGALTPAAAAASYVAKTGNQVMAGGLTVGAPGLTFPDGTTQDSAATVAAYISAASSQTVIGNVYTAFLNWNIVDSVNGGSFTSGGIWTPPVKGLYQINYGANFANNAVTSAGIYAQLRRNATVVDSVGCGGTTIFPILRGNIVMALLPTDAVDVGALISSGTAAGVTGSLNAVLIHKLP